MHSTGFAPAFTLSLSDRERSRKPLNNHRLGRLGQYNIKKNKDLVIDK